MYSFKSIVLIAAAFTIGAECSAVPAVAAAPLIAPGQIGYAHAVPQNIPPYASQVSVVNRALSPLVAAPVAAPFAAPLAAPIAAPLAAPWAAPLAAPLSAPLPAPFGAPVPAPLAPAPYLAGPAPYALPAAYAGAPAPYAAAPGYAAPFPYSTPLLRSPYGYAPAYVR